MHSTASVHLRNEQIRQTTLDHLEVTSDHLVGQRADQTDHLAMQRVGDLRETSSNNEEYSNSTQLSDRPEKHLESSDTHGKTRSISLRERNDRSSLQRDIDSLIQQLAAMLLTDDHQSVLCSLGILNNLTADNRINKSLLVKLNGVQTLMQKLMMNTDGNDDLIEVAVSERNAFESDHSSFLLFSALHTSAHHRSAWSRERGSRNDSKVLRHWNDHQTSPRQELQRALGHCQSRSRSDQESRAVADDHSLPVRTECHSATDWITDRGRSRTNETDRLSTTMGHFVGSDRRRVDSFEQRSLGSIDHERNALSIDSHSRKCRTLQERPIDLFRLRSLFIFRHVRYNSLPINCWKNWIWNPILILINNVCSSLFIFFISTEPLSLLIYFSLSM